MLAREAVEPRGQRDVGRGRVLALQRRQPADRLGGRQLLPLEQQLPRRERGGELGTRERPRLGYRSAQGRPSQLAGGPGRQRPNGAYASLEEPVSLSTPAPWRSASSERT